jgi:group II intron reverse transcriptase/maturase
VIVNKNTEKSNKSKPKLVNAILYRDLILAKLTFNPEGKCTNAFKTMCDPKVLKIAYLMIKSKAGNMTEGVDKLTLDGINEDWFNMTTEALLKDTYKPNPVRRVNIPKPNGKTRPLGISSPRDKIVQQAMRLVLEVVLEPKFKDTSHGFRPNRSCHSALKNIRDWKGVGWFIEGDISKFFDRIDHNLLSQTLAEHFREKRFDNLYWKFVKAGYVEFDTRGKKHHPTIIGVPQGGIISPILSNLILDKLDGFVENLKGEFEKSNQDQKHFLINPKHSALSTKVQNLRARINRFKSKYICPKALKEDKLKVMQERNKLKSSIPNPNYVRIEYVRYADDWLIGLWGNRETALEIKEKIKNFLASLDLELSEEKTLVTEARGGTAHFLGTEIQKKHNPKMILVRRGHRLFKQRVTSGNIYMEFPVNKVIKKLAEKKLLEIKEDKWIMSSLSHLLALPDRDIVIRYKATLNGLYNYYSFTDNIYQFNKIFWILRESLRMTLSRKHKMSITEFEKKYGGTRSSIVVTSRKKNSWIATKFEIPNLRKNVTNFLTTTDRDPLSFLNMEIRTKNDFGQPCASCGSIEKVEMHHLRHIRTINVSLNTFDQQMAKINRKQIPLCFKCHREVHAGKYDGKSLKFLARNSPKKD